VGDKTSLAVLPLVAACDVPVGKMSGRGLGSSGGTLDKMESISGWSSNLKLDAFKRQLAEIGLVLAGQTADLAPADGKLYALRDVTATVANKSLIAASIMSKKLAAGADGIVLDVKTGTGAFMPTVEAAQELARLMVDIGVDAGRRMVALISDMNQPLGHAIGNALEVKEAIAALQGEGPADFWAHCREIAGHMLVVAGKANSLEAAYDMVATVRHNGRALEKFRAMVAAQGGDVRQIDDPRLLPQATLVEPLLAPQSGTIAAMDTGAIGWACVHLGGGRFVKTDKLDHSVGLMMPVKIGDRVKKGDELGQIHANDAQRLAEARERVLAALSWSDEAVDARPLFYGTVQ
jgi:pyrimidine-nucleoside phosphorylase